MSSTPRELVIFTDGACQGNPGPGGWAWAISPEGVVHGSGGEARTTNQRMEIMAVLEALRAHAGGDDRITIVSDSTYVVNCFRDRWWVRWQQNGWKNSKKEPVANTDLWKPLIELVQRMQPGFRWVKGHSGDRMNDLVDRLAVEAAKGPFDQPRPGAAPATAADGPAQTSLF
ncbi:MAG: ribonuclease H [Acidimicrobiales bacterium]